MRLLSILGNTQSILLKNTVYCVLISFQMMYCFTIFYSLIHVDALTFIKSQFTFQSLFYLSKDLNLLVCPHTSYVVNYLDLEINLLGTPIV